VQDADLTQRMRRSDDRAARDTRVERPWALAAIGLVCAFVFVNLRPQLLFANTRPASGDIMVHNGLVGAVTRHLWDHGLMSGWSMDWSAGFPLYRFYISLPPLVVALFDVVLPSAIALKVAAALPLVLLPVAAAMLARCFRLDRLHQVLVATATLPFLFDSSHRAFGGNIVATVTGEYPYAWGMLLVVVTLAVFVRDLDRGRRSPLAGLLCAGAALCHPIAAIVVVLGLVAQMLTRPLANWRVTLTHGGTTLAIGGLVSAYWYVPFLWYGDAAIDGAFPKRTDYAAVLLPFNAWFELIFCSLAVVGCVQAVRHRHRELIALALLAITCGLLVLLLPSQAIFNMRFAPYWILLRLVFTGVGAAWLIRVGFGTRRPFAAIGVASGLVGLVTFVIAWNSATLPFEQRTTSGEGDWAVTTSSQWIIGPERTVTVDQQVQSLSFAGIERGPHAAELEELVAMLQRAADQYGCGRLAYEFEPLSRFGSLYDLQLLPSETDGCISVVNGLVTGSPVSNLQFVAESSWSIRPERYFPDLPYEADPDLDVGVRYMRELGASYFLTIEASIADGARQTEGLEEVGTVGPWVLFRVEGARLVEPLAAQPIVDTALDAKDTWADASMHWFIATDPSLRRFSPAGPSAWQRASWQDAALPVPDGAAGDASVRVTDVAMGDDSVRFRVDRVGTPVLVRVSWYPTWQAQGADGPWRVAPNWMVVVPTSNDVVLQVEAGAMETFASVVTVLGLLLAGALAVYPVVRRRRS